MRELAETLLDFEKGTAERGARYARDGRVGPISWDDSLQELHANVTGAAVYQTAWRWDRVFWLTQCSCPVGGWCKHAFALGQKALERAGVPDSPEGSPSSADAGLRLESVLERSHDRGLKPAEKRVVKAIEQMHASMRRSGWLDGDALLALARPFNPGLITGSPLSEEEIAQVFEEDEIPPDAVSFWQHLAVLFRRVGWHIPSLLAPISETKEVEARIAARRRARELDDWTRRLRRLGEAPVDAGVPASPDRQLRLCVRPKGLVFQWDGGAGNFVDMPSSEVRSNAMRDFLSAVEEWDLPSAALLAFFDEAFSRGCGRKLSLSDPEVANALGRALSHPDLQGRVVDERGEPFQRAPSPLVWEFSDDPGDAEQCVLALVRATGEAAPQPLTHLGGPPHLYLSGNLLFSGPAPLHTRADAGWKAALPRAVLEDESVVRSLVRAGSRLPGWLERRIEHIELRARLRGWLAKSAEGGEQVCFALCGMDESGTCRLVHGAAGWESENEAATETTAAGERIQFFVTDRMQAAAVHFQRLGLEWDERAKAWTREAAADTPAGLYSWLAGFPADTLVELASGLAGLREPPVRATLALEIEESGRDWFDVQLVVRSEDADLTSEDLALLMKAQGGWVRLADRGWRRLALAADADEEKRLAEIGLSAEGALPGRQRFHAMQLAAAKVDGLAAEAAWQRVQDRAAAIRALPPPEIPRDFVGELRPYQVEGFHFLAHLSANSLGGILADDMGLGKTVQALAWLLWLADRVEDGGRLRVLVVCPKSVMTNWERETARFAPRLSAAAFRRKQGSGIPDTHVVVANYVQLRNADAVFLAESWTAVILDEGQNIKNPQSQTAAVARRLRATHRLVLTGTPIENRVLDLWSLFAFAMPGLLGGQAQFSRLYDDRRDPSARSRLARRVRHFLLRRTKAQVAADLPPRIEEDVLCELEGEQLKLYQAELKRARQLVLGIGDQRAFDAQRFNILQSLLRLRQICCHPRLLGEDFDSTGSAKVAALFDQLEPILEEGHKVLVFSQFVSMLHILEGELGRREIRHLTLTGQTENRQELVDRFQADPGIPVFLLSLKAAGTGLNLTAASYVVLFDPWWNPAVEAQAIDRTHRIGQTSQVIAYRILAVDTVEEKIRRLQREKSALASEVVQEESLARILDLDDLRFVLS
ncbi:MAG: SNF2-related protein [Opitutaceae bacterium]